MDFVKEGQYVALLRTFDPGNMKIVSALKDNIVHYGKLHFDTKALIGCKLGSVFMIKDKDMIQIENFDDYDTELSATVSSNMINFEDKSQFSKEKMIKKKKKSNHANIVNVMKPTLIMINEMLFARDKVGGLRPDLLSLLMTSANIQNRCKCLLVDHNLGLVTSAIMSRILPDGICIQLVHDNAVTDTTRRTLEMLNITPDMYKDRLLAINMIDFYKIHKEEYDFSYETQVLNYRSRITQDRPAKRCRTSDDSTCDVKIVGDIGDNEVDAKVLKRDLRRDLRNHERSMAARHLKPDSLDTILIVVQNDHPLPILKLAYKFLAASGQIVIYSDIQEPLLECYEYLKTNSMAVFLTLSQPFLRKYQVLPDRSRPEMTTTGYGGFLLSGTKVYCSSITGNNLDLEGL